MRSPRRLHGVFTPREQPKRELRYSPVTPLEKRAIQALTPGYVVFPVGSPQKRFARELQSAAKLTEAQRRFLWRLAWSYRRQISDTEVTAEAERLREWANERPASQQGPREPVPVSESYEPTPDDVASLPGLFDDIEREGVIR